MKKYLGVKIVDAEPMCEFDFLKFSDKGKAIVSSEYINREGYKVVYEDGYTSWSPKEVFEKAYRPINGITFGLAIEALKQGKNVTREGWNGKGMYLTLVQGYPVNGHLNADSVDSEVVGKTQGKAGQMLSHIVMKTAGDSHFWGAGYSDYVPWLASQTDILAEDWMIVE